MAEFLLKHLAAERGCWDELFIASAATSTEEIGNPVHHGTVKKLAEHGISCAGKHAVQLTRGDYQAYDYLLGMDSYNLRNMTRILGTDDPQKIRRLLDFSSHPRDITDPWYTGNFDITYDDILEGCHAFLDDLEANGLIHPRNRRKK
jgi:protein-tyrosine phosphatase